MDVSVDLTSEPTPFKEEHNKSAQFKLACMISIGKLTGICVSRIYVDAFVNESKLGSFQHIIQAPHDLSIVVGRLRLNQQAHGPGIPEANVGA